MQKTFLKVMMALAMEGGAISLRLIKNSRPSLKPDQSVLTKADTAISRLIRKGLSQYLKESDHLLIDEEDAKSQKYFDAALLKKTKYLWVTDPIDGTRNFANRMPLYGVSIGLLKDLKPWLGVIYFPMLDELFYCDGAKAYVVYQASALKPQKKQIKPVEQRITRQSVYFGSDAFFKNFHWDFSLCQIMLPSCAVVDLCWPTIGRGAGCFFNANLWDYAGAWPIFRKAGMDLRERNSGRVLDRLDLSAFEGQGSRTWRLKEDYIFSTQRHYSIFKSAISPLSHR